MTLTSADRLALMTSAERLPILGGGGVIALPAAEAEAAARE